MKNRRNCCRPMLMLQFPFSNANGMVSIFGFTVKCIKSVGMVKIMLNVNRDTFGDLSLCNYKVAESANPSCSNIQDTLCTCFYAVSRIMQSVCLYAIVYLQFICCHLFIFSCFQFHAAENKVKFLQRLGLPDSMPNSCSFRIKF